MIASFSEGRDKSRPLPRHLCVLSVSVVDLLFLEILSPFFCRRLQQFLADFGGARKLLDPVIRPAGVDDRHRAGVIAGFLLIFRQTRIDLVAPDAPAHIERGLRIAARRQRIWSYK